MGITLHALEEQRDEQGCCFPPWYLPNDKQRHVNTKERKEIWAELPPLHYKLRPQHPNLQDAESKIPSPTALKSRQGGAECASVCGWSITKTTPGNNQGAQICMDSYGDLLLRSCCLVQPLSLGGGGPTKQYQRPSKITKSQTVHRDGSLMKNSTGACYWTMGGGAGWVRTGPAGTLVWVCLSGSISLRNAQPCCNCLQR